MIDLILPLRLAQFLFATICLGLVGSTVEFFVGLEIIFSGYEFMIFVSVWSLLLLPYLALAPKFWERFVNKFAVLALDAVTMLFWFAAFVTLAVWRAGYGSCVDDEVGVCERVTAAVVLGAVEWLLFTPSTILAVLHVYKTRGSSRSSKPTAHARV